MIDQTNTLRVIGSSIKHSIVSNLIDQTNSLDRSIEIITINRTNDRSIDLIMIDKTNTLRVIGYSIEHSIVSNLINHLIVSRLIKMHLNRSIEIITINKTNDQSIDRITINQTNLL
jgi:hypothetical protein